MRVTVLGAGWQGIACAYDLLRHPELQVLLVDHDPAAVDNARARLRSQRLVTGLVDCNDDASLDAVLTDSAVAVSALPYRLNLGIARAAVSAGTNLVDMGGNIETVLDELRLAPAAHQAKVLLVPDCGLAPGLANVLVADAVSLLDEVEQVAIRVGGLPARRIPPWDYRLVFSIEGLLNEYTGTAAVLQDWNRREVEVLEGVEEIEFSDPPGRCQAAYTSGGSSTLPWSYAGRIRNLDYKTVRYPGHYDRLKVLQTLGLLDSEPLPLGSLRLAPLEIAKRLLGRVFDHPEVPDLVVLRITSRGRKQGQPVELVHQLIDYQDEQTGLTAMMRTTAFPVAIVAHMIASGVIAEKGAFPPERVVPPARLLAELERRDIHIERRLQLLDESNGDSR